MRARATSRLSPHLHFGWIPDDTGRWPDLGGLTDPYPLLVGLCG